MCMSWLKQLKHVGTKRDQAILSTGCFAVSFDSASCLGLELTQALVSVDGPTDTLKTLYLDSIDRGK